MHLHILHSKFINMHMDQDHSLTLNFLEVEYYTQNSGLFYSFLVYSLLFLNFGSHCKGSTIAFLLGCVMNIKSSIGHSL